MKAKYLLLALSIAAGSAVANDAPNLRAEHGVAELPTGINLLTQTAIPAPTVTVSNVAKVATVLIPATKTGGQLDVTLLDDFIEDVSPNARHYPPNFPNRTTQYNTREAIKHLSAWLEPYATAPNASFEVLIRAAKINAMGRNLDLGQEYGLRASTHIANALKLQPNHAEANFLYGAMLSEGGGFTVGKQYLDKAVSLGYLEAEQSLAQADLLNDNRAAALSRLEALQAKHPTNTQIAEQLKIVQNGGFYIWDIKDANIQVKPLPTP